MAICPAGHETEATDYCDTCGAPVDMSAQPAPTPAVDPAQQPGEKRACPNCQASNVADALFCEACGYDFTTGVMPRTSIFHIGTPSWGSGKDEPAEADARAQELAAADAGAADESPEANQADAAEAGEAGEAEAPAVAADPDVDEPDANSPESDMTDEGGPLPPTADDVADDQAPASDVGAEQPAADAGDAGEDPDAADEGDGADAPDLVDEGDDEAEKTTATAALPVPEAPADEAPSAVAGAEVSWVAEVWIDPDWYAVQQSPESLPSPGLPTIVPLRKQSILIGRPSRSRGIIPDIDCEADSGCSRRHAELTTDGSRWWIEDLGSSNGTYIGSAGAPLPERPIRTGKHELGEDDRIYVGAWTRIVIRPATADEQEL